MIDDLNFGKRLDECMKNTGYNNQKLTQELNVSKNAVGNYKNNQIPNAQILYKISQLLGTTMEYLLTGKDKNFSQDERKLLDAYKNAEPAIQEATRKLLDIKEVSSEKSFISETG